MICVWTVRLGIHFCQIRTLVTLPPLGGVAQNLSGHHTIIGPIFEQGHFKL